MRKALIVGLVLVVIVFIGIQVVPLGREHTNPPVKKEPNWNSPLTRELAVQACFDCHSNQTVWPWYSNFAPVSWFIERDVAQAREKLNFSEWDRPWPKAHESAEAVQEGEMPQWYYAWIHAQARLSAADRKMLCQGLASTFGRDEGEEMSANQAGISRWYW